MAATLVFETAELLEHVLLQLPIKDLLVNAQRVDKLFHGTIIGSIKLQQALFFKPLPGKALNFEKNAKPPQWLESPEDQEYHTLLKNPWYPFFCTVQTSSLKAKSRARDPAIQRPEASWRRMLVSQPPVMACIHSSSLVGANPGGRNWLEFHPVARGGDQVENDIDSPVTFGAIDHRTFLTARTDPAGIFKTFTHVVGAPEWQTVEFAWEVRHIKGPKPEWLLNWKEPTADLIDLFDSDSEDDDYVSDEGWIYTA